MITDPRTTPEQPAAPPGFAAVVATSPSRLQFVWQVREGFFYALALAAPLVPLLDRLPAPAPPLSPYGDRTMRMTRLALLATAALIGATTAAGAFCGFYVASTDEPLTNKASRVVLVHDAAQTVVTMASDVHGDPRQFALVIPVPTVVQRDQVRIVKPETVEHLANYTKPRLVEYYDTDPCRRRPRR